LIRLFKLSQFGVPTIRDISPFRLFIREEKTLSMEEQMKAIKYQIKNVKKLIKQNDFDVAEKIFKELLSIASCPKCRTYIAVANIESSRLNALKELGVEGEKDLLEKTLNHIEKIVGGE